MKKALLFGLNYKNTPNQLNGCINDVHNMKGFLSEKGYQVTIHTDEDIPTYTTATGILQKLNNIVAESWKEDLTHVWIHYSGHGCNVKDVSGDERDRKDECLVPSDFKHRGLVKDDYIRDIVKNFNPKTKVFMVFDCCHSGTMADLPYHYITHTPTKENDTIMKSNIVMISGCMDVQTSADAFNVNHLYKYSGAMTSCLLKVIESSKDIFDLIHALNDELKQRNFTQRPQLSSSQPMENIEFTDFIS